ncbi:hypothetical protein PY649_33620 [Rhizobium mayense]|uniref:Transposase n=1 Tax=Rhizobium mayense TaxID=1312184 RepID=A0ABT7K728_9HYPH|nr:hypothetical protein [Rhizobium mayense]MDL2403803.1 hypothetical protein [Rhizobium mayense]
MSDRIHGRYVRIIVDLPCASTKVQLRLSARRFVCDMALCCRRIFVERFGELVVPERRRTARLELSHIILDWLLEGGLQQPLQRLNDPRQQ